ncbi:hypothetical protein [Streptomyces sp. PTD5-9]|uniref:hypothetical protein n=1 Tax=Streptomyces sp. PTD5-9 TaxID=3120150 RepID=UPI0030083620
MEPVEYVSPSGSSRQVVTTPVLAVRLRAAGWRPRAEITRANTPPAPAPAAVAATPRGTAKS